MVRTFYPLIPAQAGIQEPDSQFKPSLSGVITGLVPVIQNPRRPDSWGLDCRDKPGNDTETFV